MSEHNALGYWSGLALCLTKVRSSRARCPATALISYCLLIRRLSPDGENVPQIRDMFDSKTGDILLIEGHLILGGMQLFLTLLVSQNRDNPPDMEIVSVFENYPQL